MSEVKVPIWGLCPFRSPVAAGGEVQSLGPCLQAACGLWKITASESQPDGSLRPTAGMCSFRYVAECVGEAAGALQTIAKGSRRLVETPPLISS